ncbi:hypothetical protein BDR26DRAFT_855720, partial [Obelidium mucronatum]
MPTPHQEQQQPQPQRRKTALPAVFVPPRRLLAAEVAELHSPSDWDHAFGPARTNQEPLPKRAEVQLLAMSDDDEDDGGAALFVRKTIPRSARTPVRNRYTFKIGTTEHSTFGDAIADLMSKTTSDSDLSGMERIRVKTPVDRALMLDGDGNESTDRSSSETLAKGIMIPSAPSFMHRSISEGGARYNSASSSSSSPGSSSAFLQPGESISMDIYGTSSSSVASNGSVKKGRFEVRPL